MAERQRSRNPPLLIVFLQSASLFIMHRTRQCRFNALHLLKSLMRVANASWKKHYPLRVLEEIAHIHTYGAIYKLYNLYLYINILYTAIDLPVDLIE